MRIATDLSPDAVLTALFATRGFLNASVRDQSVHEFLETVVYC